MKKIALLTALIIGLCFGHSSKAKAQSSKTGVRFMPQVGLNLTKLTNGPISQNEKFRAGVEAGIWLQSKKTVFIMPGLFFAQQGLNEVYLDDIQNNYDTLINNVDYKAIKVPIMFGIQALGARIYTGPSFTYVLDTDNPTFTSDEFNDLALGLNVGAGFNFLLFSFDVRYEYGISDVFITQKSLANTLTISAGLKF